MRTSNKRVKRIKAIEKLKTYQIRMNDVVADMSDTEVRNKINEIIDHINSQLPRRVKK